MNKKERAKRAAKLMQIVLPRGQASFSSGLVGNVHERDPHGKDPHQPGAKLDADKPRAWLMLQGFGQALTAVADVTTKGAAKYTPDGWRHVANGSERYMEAFARHALALARGEQTDPDTGCLHKAQMAWNLLASLELDMASKATP